MIGKREMHHHAVQERIQDQLYKCSPAEYSEVFEDLIITGCHSILVDNFANEAEKEKQYKAMDKIIREQAPAIPLFYDEVLHFLKPNVQGWESNGLNLISLKKVSKQ
jgi:hypothetical protein